MKRPSIALACILKNEIHNLKQFFSSIEHCFDAIYFTDTGSTDGTIEELESYQKRGNPARAPLFFNHFTWVKDFSRARQFAFDSVDKAIDYTMWLDLDDVLNNAESFIDWRDHLMKLADFWVATYHYASNAEGKPVCSFARERVVSNRHQFKWKYFVHEGILPTSNAKLPTRIEYAPSWSVVHKRKSEDLKNDQKRNLRIFEANLTGMDPRMQYYYGKELFENQKPLEAFNWLLKAVAEENLEFHDRVMALQYLCLSCMQLNQFEKAIDFAIRGLQIAPLRAEFYIVMGDCYVKQQKFQEAKPYYLAASACPFTNDQSIVGALNAHQDSYTRYPMLQLARVCHQLGDLEKAKEYSNKAITYGPDPEAIAVYNEVINLEAKANTIHINTQKSVDEIVITGHPIGFYEWDEEIYQEKGIGGSETAAIEMARHLSDLSGRCVRIFNNRKTSKTFGKVSYHPCDETIQYFAENRPQVHIAWRHNFKLTKAPTFVWNHDLGFPGLRSQDHYEKALVLSNFHAGYVRNLYGIPNSKLIVTRNGINPKRFENLDLTKTPGKVVWSSSPDRGLMTAIHAMDPIAESLGLTLHVYYGFDNMRKNNKGHEADEMEREMRKRPWIHAHGNLEQKALTKELASACLWLYPTDFLETYCITAIEMLCAGVYPIVRYWGALPDTLGKAAVDGMADLIQGDNPMDYTQAILRALETKKWERVKVDAELHSWEKVARSWLEFLPLSS